MKKTVLVAVALLLVAGITSCKKGYTCTCTYPATSGEPSSSTSINDTKKNATISCNTISIAAATTHDGSCTLH